MKLAIVLGTRPEIIKMAPLIRECRNRDIDHFVLHTGQHYSYAMDRVFFEDLELGEAKFNLEVGSGSHAVQTGRILEGAEKVFIEERPDVVLVQGDTNTVMAAALAAKKLGIKVGHVEAGLRSFDRAMPEEINRIVADHISDYLFAPTEASRRYLQDEGIVRGVHVTGNTIVDAVFQAKEIAAERSKVLKTLGVAPRKYILATAHRAEGVDNRERLSGMLKGIRLSADGLGMPVLFPMHPRTQVRVKEFGLSLDGIKVVDPVGYLDFLQLEANADLVLTDSGGVQEEACILRVPCVTLRENTERPETIEVGSNLLAGSNPDCILAAAMKMEASGRNWPNPFGDGLSSKRILDTINEELSAESRGYTGGNGHN